MKYLMNLPEFGIESNQLPASLTVSTPDLTSCLQVEKHTVNSFKNQIGNVKKKEHYFHLFAIYC